MTSTRTGSARNGADRFPLNEERAKTAMAIAAHSHPFVVGVDSHAIIAVPRGERIDDRDFPATGAGISVVLLLGLPRRTDADLATLWVIEGAASYGAVLAGAVADAGHQAA